MTPPKTDARGEDQGRGARRRWRDVFEHLLPLIVAAIVVILAILAVLSVGVFRNASRASEAAKTARVAVERQRLTALNGCERVQLLRDDQNVTAWGVYVLLNQPQPATSQFSALFAKVDPATRALLQALLASSEGSRPLMARVRDAQRYLPPTDCERASRNPRYRFPQPIPFSRVAHCYNPATNDRPVAPCPR